MYYTTTEHSRAERLLKRVEPSRIYNELTRFASGYHAYCCLVSLVRCQAALSFSCRVCVPKMTACELSERLVVAQLAAREPPGAILPCGQPGLTFYKSRRPSIAFSIVTSSAYSKSAPTGIPTPMRVTRTPSGFSNFDK